MNDKIQNTVPFDTEHHPRPHGLWETYWDNGQIRFKGRFIHGERSGLHIWFHGHGGVRDKYFFI